MPQLNLCPDVAQFNRLAAGALSSADKDSLLEHLECCDACAQRLDTQPGQETLLELLRQGKSHGEGPPEEDVARLVARLSKLRPMAARNATPPAELIFRCECGKNLKVAFDAAGKKVKCPHCHRISMVPSLQASAAAQSQTVPLAQAAPAQGETATVAPADVGATVSSASVSDASTTGTKIGHVDGDTVAPEENRDAELIEFLSPPQAPDELGRLGPYRILKILGAGGMGVVFKAEDPHLKRHVAIKAMLPGLGASRSAKQRFLREAQSAAKIKHDHIVSIYQVGEERGVPFLAMEFLLGEPLDERLKREKKLPAPEILRIGVEIAEGLAAAHEAGLIHRDIKPANIWLEGKKARVKILDFGLARATAEQQHLTQSGAIVGTPAYMAPEQAQGKPVDHRCDLFSLGVVLYRLCTGRQPFLGTDTVSTLMAVSTQEPAPPANLNTDLPAGLSDLVMKLLSKDPAQRLGSAEEVVQALTKLGQHPAVPVALPIGSARTIADTVAFDTSALAPARPTVSPRKARPVFVAAIAIAALSFCVLIAGGVIVYRLAFQTGSGELIVETEGDAKVAFEKGKLLIFEPGGTVPLYTLSPHEKNKDLPLGKYKLKVVDANGVELNFNEFEMTKKGWKVRVRLTPNNPIAKNGPDKGRLPKTFTNDLGMEFARIPKGKAWLGGGSGTPGSIVFEVERDFYLGVYEVTQEEWLKLMDANPSHFSRTGSGDGEVKFVSDADLKKFPVENVSWNACQTFIAHLNKKVSEPGWTYRLPTEAEWEYACRGGPAFEKEDHRFDFYLDVATNTLAANKANFGGEAGYGRTCKVGSYAANRLGLHDMHGNVWEWCEDFYDKHKVVHVTRGGSWEVKTADLCRAAKRGNNVPEFHDPCVGFRIARVPVAVATAKPAIAEKGVLDYAEIHDADEKRFDAWIAQMQKDGFRPVSLSIQVVKDVPRYTAVAVKEEKKLIWEFSRSIIGMDLPLIEEMWGKNYSAAIQNPYTQGGKHRAAVVWLWNMPRTWMWSGDKPFIANKIAAASAEKLRPIYRSANDQGPTVVYSILFGPDDGNPTDEAIDLAFDDCKALIEKRKGDGWRPKNLYTYGAGAKLLFGVTLVREKDRPDWDISWSLTPAAYEAELIARKRQGFRPHTTVGHDDDAGALRFSVTWIRYRSADTAAPISPQPKQNAEHGVRGFAEIHDADEKRFDAWIAQMRKDGFRPARMTVQTVKDAPRYTAVALKDDRNWPWEFTRVDQEVDGHASGYWKKKFEAVAVALFRDKGKTREAYLWAKDDSLDNSGLWFGDAAYIESKIKLARKKKSRLISRTAVFEGNEPQYCIFFEAPDGVPWQESYSLVLDDLKAYVEKHQADGWRPDHFCYYGVGAKRLFGAILIKDPNKTDWDVSWSLAPAEYAKELSMRQIKGFRPLTVVGHEDNAGAQCFSVIWIRYRLLTAEGRAPDLANAKIIVDRDFRQPIASYPRESSADYEVGFQNGRFRVEVKNPGAWWSWSENKYSQFAAEVTGQVTGPVSGAWGLAITDEANKHGVDLKIDSAGTLHIIPIPWGEEKDIGPLVPPITHNAIKPGKEFNKLLVILRGRQLEVYVNGVPVTRPLLLDRDLAPAPLMLQGFSGAEPGAVAQFERFTVWSADGLPRVPADTVPAAPSPE